MDDEPATIIAGERHERYDITSAINARRPVYARPGYRLDPTPPSMWDELVELFEAAEWAAMWGPRPVVARAIGYILGAGIIFAIAFIVGRAVLGHGG